jgi:hypothetical protein
MSTDQLRLQKLLKKTETRCQKADITTKTNKKDGLFTINLPTTSNETKKLIIRVNSSYDLPLLNMLNETSFEKFRGISGYRAIWSKELGLIEAIINIVAPSDDFYLYEGDGTKIEYNSKEGKFNGMIISIDKITKTLGIIDFLQNNIEYDLRTFGSLRYPNKIKSLILLKTSIKINYAQLNNQDQATKILEHVANALFFQIDTHGLTIYLAPEQERRGNLFNPISLNKAPLSFPEYQYDTKPISSYWYASSAQNMPLIQYLGYYQVIEHYFNYYTTDNNKSIGEKHVIKRTLENYVTEEQIEAFISSNEKRSIFFKDSRKYGPISNENIFIGNSEKEGDIVAGTAFRIYAIRCRIVHAKEIGDGKNVEPTLSPFSKEAGKLQHDIELIKFIARAIIEASKQQLSLY